MASVHREILIDAPAGGVWDALRDWGALHELAPGFVTDTTLDGSDRLVTFANGTVLREIFLDCDEEKRRLAWSIVDGPYTHHNGSAQIVPVSVQRSRFVWISDVLPDAAAPRTAEMMEQGLKAMKATLEANGGDA